MPVARQHHRSTVNNFQTRSSCRLAQISFTERHYDNDSHPAAVALHHPQETDFKLTAILHGASKSRCVKPRRIYAMRQLQRQHAHNSLTARPGCIQVIREERNEGCIGCILTSFDPVQDGIYDSLAALNNYLDPFLDQVGALTSYHDIE